MFAINIFPGIGHLELLTLLSRARREDTWDSLRFVGLHPEDVLRIRPTLLQFLVDRNRTKEHPWNTLLVLWLVPSMEMENLILEILNLHLFHSVYFKCCLREDPALPLPPPAGGLSALSIPRSILSHIITGHSVEKLTLCNSTLSIEDAQLLYAKAREERAYQQYRRRQLAPRIPGEEKQLHMLEFITCTFEPNAFYYIGDALKELESLDTLKIWHSPLANAEQVHLFTSLRDHPSLSRLDWMERGGGGVVTTTTANMPIAASTVVAAEEENALFSAGPSSSSLKEAFDLLLSSSNCHLRVLGLSLGSLDRIADLLSRLTSNDTVEWLDLSYNGNHHSTSTTTTNNSNAMIVEEQVFGSLYKFRNLRNLDLFCTRLSVTAFDSMISHPVPTIEHISCWRDDLWEGKPSDHSNTVLRILESHPTLIEFYGGLHWRTVAVQFQFDIRRVYRHGRIAAVGANNDKTMQQLQHPILEEDLPMGLWPLVLERANRLMTSDFRRSRTLYWLLNQGPAFCALPLGNSHHDPK